MEKKITIDIYLEQTCNDLVTECNLIGKNLPTGSDNKSVNYSRQLMADIMSPDDGETRSIVMRAHTEALGNVKRACRKYLTSGRTEDDNKLERLATVTYKPTYETDGNGNPTSTPATDENGHIIYSDEVDEVEYEKVELEMVIPGWDTAVTDALKNHIHKYIVDYVMWRFLQNQHDPKCAEYKKLADDEDMPLIEEDLTMRDRLANRKAHFWD